MALVVVAGLGVVAPPGDGAATSIVGASPFPERLVDLAAEPADTLIAGANDKDQLGNDLRAGDLNADGLADLAAGAHWGSTGGRNIVGRGYGVFGRERWPALVDLNQLMQRDWSFIGAGREARMGSAVAVGDLSGDGIDDLALGSLLADPYDQANAGAVYVMHGGAGVGGHVDFLQSQADAFIAGHSDRLGSDRLGTDLAIADFNADGRNDLAVAAVFRENSAGAVFVWWGPFGRGRTVNRLTAPADWTILGGRANAFVGAGIRAGDLTGDGTDDLAASAFSDPGGPAGSGAVYVFPGGRGVGGILDLAKTPAPVAIVGDPEMYLGAALSPGARSSRGQAIEIADLTGDGRPDLLAGAPLSRSRLGDVVLLAGPLTPGRHDLAATPHLRLSGTDADGRFGWTVASGWLDRDPWRDLIGAAPSAAADGRAVAGVVYGLRGPLPVTGTLSIAADTVPLVVLGPAAGAGNAGISAVLADTDGDEEDDLHLGFPDSAPLGRNSVGAVHVLRGPLLAMLPTATPTATDTETPTASPPPTSTPVATASPSSTPTMTPTDVPPPGSATPTRTPTRTVAPGRTASATRTATRATATTRTPTVGARTATGTVTVSVAGRITPRAYLPRVLRARGR